jgi:hypothetical protein
MQLDRLQVEDLLGCEIPIEEAVYGIGMGDLAPLLSYLNEQRKAPSRPLATVSEVSENKLDFNELDDDSRRQMRQSMAYTHLVDDYYTKSIDETEAEEVSVGFSSYYQVVRAEWPEPEDVLWQMEMYVLGNQSPAPNIERCAWIILAYFFERCFIFEEPPADWHPSPLAVS